MPITESFLRRGLPSQTNRLHFEAEMQSACISVHCTSSDLCATEFLWQWSAPNWHSSGSLIHHSHCHFAYLMRLIRFALCASRTAAESNGLPCSHHGHVFALVLVGWLSDPNGNFLFLFLPSWVNFPQKCYTEKSLNSTALAAHKKSLVAFFFHFFWRQYACMPRKCASSKCHWHWIRMYCGDYF